MDPFLAFWVPVGSLIVAAIAVVVGPLVSWRIAKHQSENNLKVANKQIIAPMRQAWIDTLRDRVAEVISTAHWFYVSGQDSAISPTTEEESDIELRRVERKLLFLINQVELMLNPNEKKHVKLLDSLNIVRSTIWPGMNRAAEFPDSVEKTNAICKAVLKREWERVKYEI